MPQDNLTIQFQKELEKRGIAASLTEIEDVLKKEGIDPTPGTTPSPPSPGPAPDLWGALKGEALPDWFEGETGGFGYEGGTGALIGKTLWSFVETAGFGVPGALLRGIDKERYEEWAIPRTTAERWATAIGGVAGFMPPFTLARSVAAAALKGARVVKGGRIVGYGAEAAGKKFTDNTVRILKSDKEFLKWAGSKGMGPDDIEKFIRESDFVSAGAQAITKIGSRKGARIFSPQSMRTQYAKELEENIPKIINSKIDDIAKLEVDFVVNDRAKQLIAREVGKYVGGKYNFPITNLHQALSVKMGNGKMASLAASAAEEAILFTAVEIPLNFFSSVNNEQVDFNLFKTVGHSVALGSALGLIRLIPGGSDAGILPTAFKRMNQYLSRRTRWSQYNVNKPEHRMLLVKHAEHLWEAQDDIFSVLTRSDKGIRKLLRDKKDVPSFIKGTEKEAAAGATELKKWMSSLEDAFMKDWWPGFVKQAGQDLLGSSRRMIAGSIAFNVGTLIAYQNDELPFEDLVFHTLLGAVLSKKGRDIEYRNEHGDMVMIPGTKRPMFHDTKFEKVNKYLDMLGMNQDHAAFRNIINNMEVVKKYGTPDLTHNDMVKLIDIANDAKLFIDTSEEPVLKNKSVDSNPLYESVKMILESTIEDPMTKRVKTLDELSNTEIIDLMTTLRTKKFESLAEYRTVKSSQLGITSPFDVFDILLSTSKPTTKAALKVYESALREAFDTIYEMEYVAGGGRAEDAPTVDIDPNTGKMILRPISFETNTVGQNADRMGGLFGHGEDKNSVLGILRNRVTISGQPIVFRGEMNRRLFGSRDTDSRGDMDKWDREYHKTIFGDMDVADENLITLGEKVFNDKLRRSMFADAIVTSWKEMSYLRDRDSASSVFKEEVGNVKDLIDKIYGTGKPYLPSSLSVVDASNNRLGSESPEQRFATNLLGILSSDSKYSIEYAEISRQVGIEAEPRTANQTDVKTLMDRFDSYGLLDGFRGEEGDVETYVKRLSDYTFEKSLGNATRTDGTPLRDEDYAVLQVLQEARIAGRNFDMVALKDYVTSLKETIKKSDITSAADAKAINSDVSAWVMRNFDKVDKVFDELSKSTDKVDVELHSIFKSLAEQARQEGTSKESVAWLIGDYLSLYEKTLKPLWIDGKGNGILKESHYKGVPTEDFMYRIVTQFEAIRSGAVKSNYNRLLSSIQDIYDTTKVAEHKEFLATVHNSLFNQMGNTTKVIELLKKYNIWKPQNAQWLLNADDKTLSQRIKETSEYLRLLTQPLTTDRTIELLTERDKLDFLPKQDSDLTVSMTFDKLTTDWGIELPEFGDIKPQDFVLQDVFSSYGNFSLDSFFDYMMSRMVVREIDGNKFDRSNWKEMPYYEQQRITSDMHKVWIGLTQTRPVRHLKLSQGDNPMSEPDTVRKNHLTDELEDLFGEVIFGDMNYKLTNGKTYNITNVSGNILGDYLSDFAKVGQRMEQRKRMEEEIPWKHTQQTGYAAAFLGDLDYVIGVPIHPYHEGVLLGQHKLADRFVRRLLSVKDRFEDAEIREAAQDMIKKYVEDDSTRIVEKKERADGEFEYIFRRSTFEDVRASDEVSLMLNTVFYDSKMGEIYWKSMINSKKDTKGYTPEKELAHDVMRRMRLMANGSTLKLEQSAIKDVADFYDRYFSADELGDDFEIVRNVLKPLAKTGMVKAHIIRDEGDVTNPNATSAFENLRKQILAERGAASEDFKIMGLDVDTDGKIRYPGGLGDTSHVNSVIIVKQDFMGAMRMITGDFWRSNAVANKPVISFADDGKAAFIGKTMFVVDGNFETYLANNKINMVIFSSAVKGMGSDYAGKVIDFESYNINSIEDLQSRVMDAGTHEVKLPVDSIGIQMWQAEDKPARIPMHIGADLVGERLNSDYFDWLMSKAVNSYQDKTGKIMSGTQVDNMISFGKVLFGDTGGDMDNQMYSTMGKMLEYNMYPMFLPWRRTMKNAMMRHFIQQEGVFSPINEFGSQSAAIPSYYAFDHPKGLRNTLFYGDNRDIYTYGQGEAGINNRSKGIGDNLSIILHRPDKPDKIVSWGDFIKDRRIFIEQEFKGRRLSKEGKALVNTFRGKLENFVIDGRRVNTQGEVFDFLKNLNEIVRPEGSTGEIAVVWSRIPSLKSSDKVIVGLKGYVEEGNLARLNTVDFWTRLEGDHDFDKVNYWWDTPTSVLNEWSGNSGNVMSVTNTSVPTSIAGLSFDNPASMREYNFNSAKATKMRGPVVKARRMIQWMKHYQGKNTEVSGYNIVVGPDSEIRISIDQGRADELDRLIATDSQRIIDSKDGWTREDFTDDYYRQLLFGNERWQVADNAGRERPWRGIFNVHRKDLRTQKWRASEDVLDKMWEDAIIESIKPYQGFLQLATDVYEGGEAKKVDYTTLVEGYEAYRDGMKRLNRLVFRRMKKIYPEPGQLRDLFGDDAKNPRDIFGLRNALFPKPADRTRINSVGGDAMRLLPFDRGIWAVASVDRMFVEKPRKLSRLSEDDFDKIWEEHIDKDNLTSLVIEDSVKRIRAEAKSIAILNSIGSKISRTQYSIDRMNRKQKSFPDSSNEELITLFKNRLAKLEEVKSGIEKRVLSDRETGAAIRNSIYSQMILSLEKGWPVKLRRYEKSPDGTRMVLGSPETVNLKAMSPNKRKDWINKNRTRIAKNIWQNNKLVPQIKGLDSNEYAQLAMWHQTMTEFYGYSLDPREFDYANQFELDVMDARAEVTQTWKNKFAGKDYAPNEREDVVMADLMNDVMEKHYAHWESQQNGLGLLWVFKFMTPVPDMRVATYHQGKWMPGFKNIDSETKYINLGLNFINNTDKIPENAPLKLYARKASFPAPDFASQADRKGQIFKMVAETFTDKMRVLYGETPARDISKMSAEEALRMGTAENKSDMFDFKLGSEDGARRENTKMEDFFDVVDSGDLDKIANLSPEIKRYYGVTGTDIAIDYLNMRRAPTGYDRLYDIRQLADFLFRPSKVLNSRGKLRTVKDLRSFYGFVKRNSKLTFGELAQTDMLTGKDVPHLDINPFGGKYGPAAESSEAVQQTWINKTTSILC